MLTDQKERGAVRRLEIDVLKGRVVRKTEASTLRSLVDCATVAIVHIAIHTGNRDGLCGVCARKGVLLQKFAADNDRAVLVGIKQVVRRVDGRDRIRCGQTVRLIVAVPSQVHNGCRACCRGAECAGQQHQKCRDKRNAEFAEMFFHCVQSPFIDARASYVLFIIG